MNSQALENMNDQQKENWADRLLAEYEDGRNELKAMGNKLDLENDLDKQDKKQINSMINDMSFSMKWMKIGRRPGNMRGIDKRSAYQRRALIDMDIFPSLDIQPEERVLTQEEREEVIKILAMLSHRERQCYLLHMANGFSLAEIGRELGISKRSAQQYVDRAKKKVGGIIEKAS
ncbi:sigma factor-like helix-turn-helix DNA-binding protein [Microbulbifer pacificus]|uniref:sigma factor-like helix-turn-helix DNA-binding protein n=1 Tax=Microbulbifer pacificus TaxID=407164 RepID=UPI0018F8B728|nr:sigma factor-like helix-turn-helix DNA-binding protein [Microbulbifer pacificus]